MTLAEWEAEMKAEGRWEEFVARQRADEEQQQRNLEEFQRAEAPLVEDLRKAGVNVASVMDLVTDRTNSYAAVLPLLIDHVQRPYLERVRAAIARAIAIPQARYAWPLLVDLYRREPDNYAKEALAGVLANSVDESTIDELIELLHDRSLGGSRMILLQGFIRRRDPKTRAMLMDEKARKVLMALGTDPEQVVRKQAEYILKTERQKAERREKRRESKRK